MCQVANMTLSKEGSEVQSTELQVKEHHCAVRVSCLSFGGLSVFTFLVLTLV